MGCGASAGQQYHCAQFGIVKEGATNAWEDPVHSISQSADADPAPISLGGGWMYEASPEVWQAFPSDVSAAMLVAWYCRESRFAYNNEEGGAFEVDFESLMQTDQRTGAQQRVGWIGSGQSSSEGGNYDDNGHGQEADEEVAWVEYDEHLEDRLVDAWASGKKRVYYTAHGQEYEVDFTEMLQTNLTTGEQQDIGMEEIDESSPVAAVEPAKGGSQLAERGGAGGGGGGGWVRYVDPSTGQAYYSDGQTSYWDTSGPEDGGAASGAASAAPMAAAAKSWVQYTDPTTGHPYWSDGVTATWERPVDESGAASRGVTTETTPQRSSGSDHGSQGESSAEHGGRPSKRDKKWTLGGQQQAAAPSTKDAPQQAAMPFMQPRLNAEVAAPPMQPTLNSEAQSRPPPTSLGGHRSPQPYGAALHSRPAPQQAFEATPAQPQPGQFRGSLGGRAKPSSSETSSAAKRPRPEATGRPKVHIYQAPPRAGPKKERKWTLGPEQQRDRRACNAPAAKPRAPPVGGTGPGRPGAPGGRGSNGGGASGPSLPTGSEWPADPAARRVAEALFRDMDKSKKAALDERQKAYRAACLNWHPDKNPKHQGLAKEVFQFLQSLKAWYFA